MDEVSQETRDWYMRLVKLQKTSAEMDGDEVASADWQYGYDHMVRTARIQADEIERLRAALELAIGLGEELGLTEMEVDAIREKAAGGIHKP